MTQVGEAFIRLRPDVSGFRAEAQTEVAAAVTGAGVTVPITPKLSSASVATWERIAGSGAVVPVPIKPTLAPGAAQAVETTVANSISQGLATGTRGRFGSATSREAQAAAQAFGGLGQRLSQQLAFFGPTGLAIGATTLAAAAAAKQFASFEQELNTFQVVAGATNKQMTDASTIAKQLGADIRLPAVSASDAAIAMTELSKAGLSVKDTFAGTRGVLELATAAQIDNAQAAELTANALNAFKLPGRDAVRVADLLTGAANAAQGSISDMGLALRQSAAVARLAGFNIDETVTSLTVLAKAGIQGSDAGTSLRVALLRLIAPTSQASKLLDALGINVRNAQGQIKPQVFEDLRTTLAKLTPATRQTALAMIFGSDAIRAASFLSEEGAANFAALEEKVTRAGQAQEVSAARTKGLAGSFSSLQSSAETAGVTIGAGLAPAIEDLAGGINIGIGAITKLGDVIHKLPGPVRTLIGPLGVLREGVHLLALSFNELEGHTHVFSTIGNAIKSAAIGLTQNAPPANSGTIGRVSLATQAEEQANRLSSAASEIAHAQDEIRDKSTLGLFANVGTQVEAEKDALHNLSTQAVATATEGGKSVGKAFVTAAAQAIIDNAKLQVTAAKQALADTIRQGNIAVEEAAVEAKQNLTQIGDQLAAQAAQIIDSGPLGQRIKQLQAILDRTQAGDQRRQLANQLRDAQQTLAQARASIAFTGPKNATQLAADQKFLQPFVDKVKDAQAALKEFTTEGVITRLQKQADAEKAVVTKGLADVIAQFNAGTISMQAANTRIAGILGKNIGPFQSAGKSLGFAFTQGFRAELQGLKDQIAAIIAGPQTTKTGAEPRIVSPAQAAVQAAADNAKARQDLAQAEKDLRKAIADSTKKPTQGETNIARILRQIRDELGTPARPSTRRTESVAPSTQATTNPTRTAGG